MPETKQEQKPQAPQTLVEKLAAVMAAVERVPKNGENKFHGYKYATEADLSDAVRANLARYGVMLIPSVEKVEWSKVPTKSGEERLATLTVRFTATDGKDKIEFTVLGEGQDRGDKATYKAMTGATKYALLKLFLIPTGDDPEHDGETDEKPAQRPNPAKHAKAADEVRAAMRTPAFRKQEAIREINAMGLDVRGTLKDILGRTFPEGQDIRLNNEAELEKVEERIVLLKAQRNGERASAN
jgi:hypothetical protein